MEESAWCSKWGTFKVSGSFSRGRPRKTWNEVIRRDLKERKVNKNITKGRNACKSFIRNCPTHGSMKNILKKRLWWYWAHTPKLLTAWTFWGLLQTLFSIFTNLITWDWISSFFFSVPEMNILFTVKILLLQEFEFETTVF